MDYYALAQGLRVVDVWKSGNETGWVTPAVLYNPQLRAKDGQVKAPTWAGHWSFWLDHGTAGMNTLRFWGEGRSAVPGNWTLANYLVPKEQTQYADGKTHDTSNVVFKMVPDGYACNHAGECVGPIWNGTSIGMEYESLQNGTHDITDMQYAKGALVYAHDSRAYGIADWFRVAHGMVAVNPWGRRTDPWAGRFDIARSWESVQAIRHDTRIMKLWGFA